MLDVDLTAVSPDALDHALEHLRGNGDGEHDMPSAELIELLKTAIQREASDLHLVPDYPPMLRIHGQLKPASEAPLTGEQTRAMVASLLPERSRGPAEETKNMDCSVALHYRGGESRFRASVYLAQGQWCACLRHIPHEIPSLDWLGFPPDLAQRLISHSNGLVVVTGVVGSGKTATLAALVHLLRQNTNKRVLTVEEPIEYLHPATLQAEISNLKSQISNPKSPLGGQSEVSNLKSQIGGLVTQREVGRDVDSFADGLKHGLRQDPDVILVGEIRDRETAQMALSAAETGHLILTTLHTRDAKGAISRIVDIFPQETQDDIRAQLAMSLRSVVCQHLLPSMTEGEKRVLAMEVLHANQQVQVAIRAGKIEMLESAIQTGKRDGMITLDEDLQRLVNAARISLETARRFAKDPNALTATTNAWT